MIKIKEAKIEKIVLSVHFIVKTNTKGQSCGTSLINEVMIVTVMHFVTQNVSIDPS